MTLPVQSWGGQRDTRLQKYTKSFTRLAMAAARREVYIHRRALTSVTRSRDDDHSLALESLCTCSMALPSLARRRADTACRAASALLHPALLAALTQPTANSSQKVGDTAAQIRAAISTRLHGHLSTANQSSLSSVRSVFGSQYD